MRMTSFIIGGILGAAAATYFSKSDKNLMETLSQAGVMANKWMDRAKQLIEISPLANQQSHDISGGNSMSEYQTQ